MRKSILAQTKVVADGNLNLVYCNLLLAGVYNPLYEPLRKLYGNILLAIDGVCNKVVKSSLKFSHIACYSLCKVFENLLLYLYPVLKALVLKYRHSCIKGRREELCGESPFEP